MTPNHIHPDDLALFALQFLPADEMAVLRAHLERCPACRQELAEIQGDLAVVALTAEMHSPPAAARERLLSQISREPKARPTAALRDERNDLQPAANSTAVLRQPLTPSTTDAAEAARDAAVPRFGITSGGKRPGTAARLLPWAGWAVAASLALMLGQSFHERDTLRNEQESLRGDVIAANHQMAQLTSQTADARRVLETLTDPTAQRVTLTLSKQRPVPQGKATYVPGKGALVFLANNLEPLEPLKTYELWVIPSNGQSPIAAGTFHPDDQGNASVLLPQLPQGVTAKAFGVTVEDEGGSPTPTMPILLAGAAPAVGG